jgi:hypothetical protein
MKDLNLKNIMVQWVLMFITIAIVVQMCSPKSVSTTNTINKTVIVYDSTEKTPPAGPLVIKETHTVEIPAQVDTLAILKDYFSTHHYEQEFKNEDLRGTVSSTISQNRILNQKLDYKWLKPISTTETTEKTTVISPRGFYGGAFVNANSLRVGIGPQISYLTRKEILISAGYDLLQKSIHVGTQFKLHGTSNPKAK